MNFFVIPAIVFTLFHLNQAGPLRLQKRAAFYIANETACVVDSTVYNSGDPIPTDDPCEACRCRPPGFACVLKECDSKPGCRAVRKAGECCPEYICGCEHNGRMYRDGEEIRDPQNPCYTCHCQGSSIACGFVDCFFRVDCAPEYVPGECCPHYKHCNALDSDNSTNVEFTSSTEKAYISDESTANFKTSESPLYSEIPDSTQATKKEAEKESSEVLPPESLDASLLFSVNEGEESYKEVQTTKKDTYIESTSSDENREEISLGSEESNEENSSEKQRDNVTEILKTDFEILKEEEVPEEREISTEQSPSVAEVGSDTFTATEKNAEIFPVEQSTTAEARLSTTPPVEVTGKTTISEETVKTTASSTSVFPDSFEDADEKTNEVDKRLRSLKNLTSDDVTEFPKENAEVKNDELTDASTKETTEKVGTPAVTENPTTAKLEKDIVVKDEKSSDAVIEAVLNSDAKVATEFVETVTTVVEVKGETHSEKVDDETSIPAVSNEPEQGLLKAVSDVADEMNKEKSNEVTTSQTTVEISNSTSPKAVDISSSSISPATEKSVEKVPLYVDEIKIVPSTDAPRVSEVEMGSTVVTEVNSVKVEPLRD